MSNFTNSTGFTDFFIAANTTSSGYLVWAVIVVLPLVLYFYTVRWGKWRALTYSTFINAIVLLVLNITGLVEYWVLILDMLLFALGFWMMIQSKDSYGS